MRVLRVLLFAVAATGLAVPVACGEDEVDIDTVPGALTVDEVLDDPLALSSREITVEGVVAETLTARSFRLGEDASADTGLLVLAVDLGQRPEQGERVRVRGVLRLIETTSEEAAGEQDTDENIHEDDRRFREQLEDELGSEPAVDFADVTGSPVLQAEAVEPVS